MFSHYRLVGLDEILQERCLVRGPGWGCCSWGVVTCTHRRKPERGHPLQSETWQMAQPAAVSSAKHPWKQREGDFCAGHVQEMNTFTCSWRQQFVCKSTGFEKAWDPKVVHRDNRIVEEEADKHCVHSYLLKVKCLWSALERKGYWCIKSNI